MSELFHPEGKPLRAGTQAIPGRGGVQAHQTSATDIPPAQDLYLPQSYKQVAHALRENFNHQSRSDQQDWRLFAGQLIEFIEGMSGDASDASDALEVRTRDAQAHQRYLLALEERLEKIEGRKTGE